MVQTGTATDGAVGFPSFANAEKGARMLGAIVSAAVAAADRLLELPVG